MHPLSRPALASLITGLVLACPALSPSPAAGKGALSGGRRLLAPRVPAWLERPGREAACVNENQPPNRVPAPRGASPHALQATAHCRLVITHPHPYPHTHPYSHTCTHTHTQTPLMPTHTHTHPCSHVHMHHARTRTHTRTHTHAFSAPEAARAGRGEPQDSAGCVCVLRLVFVSFPSVFGQEESRFRS